MKHMNIIAITAHYDDMEIGAGGTMSRFGGSTVVLYPRETAAQWYEANSAAAALMIEVPSRALVGYADREDVAELDTLIFDTIITCNPWDSHPDHRKAANIAQQVARRRGCNLLYMDQTIPGGYDATAPRPNLFVAIQPSKYDALECYTSQTEKYGPEWVHSIRARDQYYGALHGVPLAEGFIAADYLL